MKMHVTGTPPTGGISIQFTSAILGTACLPIMSILHLPVWIAFLAWAAAGWVGEKHLVKLLGKLWPPFIVGTLAGTVDSWLVQWYQSQVVGASLALTTVFSMIIIFTIVFAVLWLAKVSAPFADAGAIFIGLNSYFSLAQVPHFSLFPGILGCFVTASALCLLGPILYWLALTTSRISHQQATWDSSGQDAWLNGQTQPIAALGPLALYGNGRRKTIELQGGSVIISYTEEEEDQKLKQDSLPLSFAEAVTQGGNGD